MAFLNLQLILASGSPRRKEILTAMGLDYIVDVSQVDEQANGKPDEMVIELSGRKAAAVAKLHENAIVLAADTLVYGSDQVLGKPSNSEEAFSMLKMLSGQWHEVYTGITLINTKNQRCIQRVDCTRVHFTHLSDEEIRAYVQTKEPLDKAGSYAIQGKAGMFIDRIEGSYSNVVGLPMSMLRDMLKDMYADEN